MKGKILAKNSNWSFGGKVAKKFDNHIKRSVPYYIDAHNLVLELSDFFVSKNSYCYDIGSSTGNLLFNLNSRHKDKQVKFIGIDVEKEMIKYSNSKIMQNQKNLKFVHNNIEKYRLKKSDLIISLYTMQFISPKKRITILKKIYDALNWGGAFIIFEKIRAPDARFQDLYSQIYNEFKLKERHTPFEIINKSKSLKGILEPFSDAGNLKLLKTAGFVDITPIFQWVCFKGFLCIK